MQYIINIEEDDEDIQDIFSLIIDELKEKNIEIEDEILLRFLTNPDFVGVEISRYFRQQNIFGQESAQDETESDEEPAPPHKKQKTEHSFGSSVKTGTTFFRSEKASSTSSLRSRRLPRAGR